MENWRYSHYGVIENAGDAADEVDINGNGISNLLAFALNLDPLDNNITKTDGQKPGLPDSYMENNTGKYRFLKPAGRDVINYKVEMTTDLVHWFPVPYETVGQTGIYEQVVASAPQGFHPCFFRLIVDRNDAQ